MKYLTYRNEHLSQIGMGTATSEDEVNALRTGLDHGINIIDTAESYGDSENVVGRAL